MSNNAEPGSEPVAAQGIADDEERFEHVHEFDVATRSRPDSYQEKIAIFCGLGTLK